VAPIEKGRIDLDDNRKKQVDILLQNSLLHSQIDDCTIKFLTFFSFFFFFFSFLFFNSLPSNLAMDNYPPYSHDFTVDIPDSFYQLVCSFPCTTYYLINHFLVFACRFYSTSCTNPFNGSNTRALRHGFKCSTTSYIWHGP